jgi:hypothetical protein
MVILDTLQNVRFIVDASGKQAAVQVSMDDWRTSSFIIPPSSIC